MLRLSCGILLPALGGSGIRVAKQSRALNVFICLAEASVGPTEKDNIRRSCDQKQSCAELCQSVLSFRFLFKVVFFSCLQASNDGAQLLHELLAFPRTDDLVRRVRMVTSLQLNR